MALTKEDLKAIQEALAPQFDAISERFDTIDETLAEHNKRIAVIEVNHGKKLDAVLVSQKSTNERLDRMQSQVDSIEKKLENSMIIKAVTPTANA